MVSDSALVDAPELASTPLIVVPDTVAALQTLANRVRRDSGAAVVAVTGSAGKSTTKEITAEFLAARYTVFRNRGNLNNHIGLPLSLLELRTKPDIGVLELGMNHFGEISALVRIAEPEVRVWTNVGPAHLEFFGTVEAIAEAKAEILEGADKDALLVANADDDLVMRHAEVSRGRVRTFGVERPADVRALAVRDLGIDGTTALVRTPIGEAEIRHAAAGHRESVERPRGGGRGDSIRCPSCRHRRTCGCAQTGRQARRSLARRRTRRSSTTRTTRTRKRCPARCRCWRARAVTPAALPSIGEMLELGEASAGLHRLRGRKRRVPGIGALDCGWRSERARAGRWSASTAGMPAAHVHYVENSEEAADLAVALVKPGDLVLVKGSRGIRTEVVVDRLKAEFA